MESVCSSKRTKKEASAAIQTTTNANTITRVQESRVRMESSSIDVATTIMVEV
jgi:hypothetical protein